MSNFIKSFLFGFISTLIAIVIFSIIEVPFSLSYIYGLIVGIIYMIFMNETN